MGDKYAIKLINTLFRAQNIETINLTRNNLGFKTGAMVMNLLVEQEVKNKTRIKAVDLGYNTISMLLQNSINKLLSETEFAMRVARGEEE